MNKQDNQCLPVQELQEKQYSFPYHYLVDFSNSQISFGKNWSWCISYLGRICLINDFVSKRNPSKVIDIGCGDGKLIATLSSQFIQSSFLGVDYSEQAINLARLMNRGDKQNLSFQCADITKERIDEKFDLGILMEVVEHIPKEGLLDFLKSVRSLISERGAVICTVPSTHLSVTKKHFQHFTPQSLKDEFESAGFTVKSVSLIDGKSTAFRILKMLFINRLFIVMHPKLQNFLFKYYKKLCLTSSNKGEGVLLIAESIIK